MNVTNVDDVQLFSSMGNQEPLPVGNGESGVFQGGLFPVWVGVVVAVLIFIIVRKHMTRKHGDENEEFIASAVVDAIVQNASGRATLVQEAKRAFFGGGTLESVEFAPLVRVESVYEKEGDDYLQKLVVLRRKNESDAAVTTVRRVIHYEDLPSAVRHEMIARRTDTVAFRHYEHSIKR